MAAVDDECGVVVVRDVLELGIEDWWVVDRNGFCTPLIEIES